MFKTWISISFKMAQNSFHPMAKYMELQEIICKTAHYSLRLMAKCVELQEMNFKTKSNCKTTFAHEVEGPPNRFSPMAPKRLGPALA